MEVMRYEGPELKGSRDELRLVDSESETRVRHRSHRRTNASLARST
jgi:hypothetical protein